MSFRPFSPFRPFNGPGSLEFNLLSLAPDIWLSDTGSDASVWPDLSGNGRNFTQSVASSRPSIVGGVQNGRQVRRFDGTNDRLYLDLLGTASVRMPTDETCTGICYDAGDDTIYVGDFVTGNIAHMEKAGGLLATISTPVPINSLQGLALDIPDDALWAVDRTNSTVFKLTKAGVEINSWVLAYQCNGICYDASDDSIWVSSDSDAIVRHYDAEDFSFLGSITTASALSDGLAIDGDGNLLISQDGTAYEASSILRVNKTTGATIDSYAMGYIDNIEHIAVDTSTGKWLVAVDDLYHDGIAAGNRIYTADANGVIPNAFLSAISGASIFMVRKCAANPTSAKVLFLANTPTADTARIALFVGLTSGKSSIFARRLDAVSGQQVASTASVSTTAFQTHSAIIDYSNSNADQYLNGVADGATTSFLTDGLVSNTFSTGINVGASSAANRFAGDIGEIIFFARPLSGSERLAVETYLNEKWATY